MTDSIRTRIRRLLVVAVAMALAATVALLAFYRATQQAPQFYRDALAAAGRSQRDEGQRFERQALALHNQLQHTGRWEVRFTQDEINGWLAVELPEKFPELLPQGVSDPRVAIAEGAFFLAVRYQRGGTSTIVSLAGDAHLTEQPNEVAIHLRHARAGLVPIPLSRFLQEISERAERANIPLRWTEARGMPVALVRVPIERNENGDRRLLLERVSLADDALTIGGRIESPPAEQPPLAAGQPDASETRQR